MEYHTTLFHRIKSYDLVYQKIQSKNRRITPTVFTPIFTLKEAPVCKNKRRPFTSRKYNIAHFSTVVKCFQISSTIYDKTEYINYTVYTSAYRCIPPYTIAYDRKKAAEDRQPMYHIRSFSSLGRSAHTVLFEYQLHKRITHKKYQQIRYHKTYQH